MGKLQGRTIDTSRSHQSRLQKTAVNMLHSLFSKIWEKEEVPAQWKEGIVIKLPKKGDLRDCSNYPRDHAPVSASKVSQQEFYWRG
nr:hypothetical protein BaRGS_033649 [Batillaria attramentaria]